MPFYTKQCAVIYQTYRMLNMIYSFFTVPSGIQSLIKNFPEFKQNGTKIAAFGPTTAKAAELAGLRIDIKALNPESLNDHGH